MHRTDRKRKTDSLLNAGGVIVYKMEMKGYSYAAKRIWYGIVFVVVAKVAASPKLLAGLLKVEKGLETGAAERDRRQQGKAGVSEQTTYLDSWHHLPSKC
ncbi:hypothetical protein FHL15_002378 [Xylaria flabelliformis]|uniref:Uncharacterized protein n=1 Tax=Xylaria flabelliformis TaxID=2512241 RepID=A0A553I961_9PEZI|nr:hypothetical protein FHL15_002378 [Xylaria flabelliformis]